MRIDDALDRLDVIHAQVLRSETYRGFRALPTAATGLVALLAAALQCTLVRPGDATEFAGFWIRVAVLAGCIGATDLLIYALRGGEDERRRSLRVLAQIAAPLGVGALMTWVALDADGVAIMLLPGTWACCFALALVSARPFLPDGIGVAIAFYLVAAVVLFVPDMRALLPSGIGMGITFGVGQCLTAFALRREREERDDA